MIHVSHASIETDTVEACVKHVRSLQVGKSHTSVWCDNMADVARLAFDAGFECPIRTLWSHDGVSQCAIGNVYVRDAASYGISPDECVELANILGHDVLKARPSGTAREVLMKLTPETVFWCDVFDTREKYDMFRATVPRAYFKASPGVKVVRDAMRPPIVLPSDVVDTLDAMSITEIDMNGAYRWAMRQSMPWPTGGTRFVPGKRVPQHGYTRAIVRRDTLGILRHDVRHDGWPDGECLYSAPAIQLCLDYGSDIEVISSVEYVKTRPVLRPFVMFLESVEARRPSLRPAIKRIANTMFGRMFSRPMGNALVPSSKLATKKVIGEVWRWRGYHMVNVEQEIDRVVNPAAAGTISTMVTRRLLSATEGIRNARHIYSDTDNIVYAGETESSRHLVSTSVGDFKIECVGASVWQPAHKQRVIYDAHGVPVKVAIAGVPLPQARQLATMGIAVEPERRASIGEVVSLGYGTDDTVSATWRIVDGRLTSTMHSSNKRLPVVQFEYGSDGRIARRLRPADGTGWR